ncbi:MAG TPA: hypothetical protein VK815_16720 [Candidatus Acidoferrales bacterium]|jgi:hypothetical protein|nr:hypothetical protein [Candidatus Acidoferrales bacterium]
MKTSARKRLGAIFFFGSIAVALVLQFTGYPFIGFASKVSPMIVWHDISIHWAVLPVVAVAILSLFCWLLPVRKHTRHQ